MNILFDSRREPLVLDIVINTPVSQPMALRVRDHRKPYTWYASGWEHTRPGVNHLYVRMPISPDKAIIELYNRNNGNRPKGHDNTFALTTIGLLPLHKRLDCFRSNNEQLKSFIRFAQQFAERAGVISANQSVYHSDDMRFRLNYVDVIRNRQGQPLRTCARISEDSGVIEIARNRFIHFTVPMRIAILLHEYCHYYLNENKRDEIEADLNGLLIYLSLGYPKGEAKQAFLDVFTNSPSDLNRRRYEILKKFIENFDRMELKMCA